MLVDRDAYIPGFVYKSTAVVLDDGFAARTVFLHRMEEILSDRIAVPQKPYVAGKDAAAFHASENGLRFFRERTAFVLFFKDDVAVASIVDPNAELAARIDAVQLFPQRTVAPVIKVQTADCVAARHSVCVRIQWKHISESVLQPHGVRAAEGKLILKPER